MADGRLRAFVNDQPVSAQALRPIARGLVEIHGQHDDRALVDPGMHRPLIDAYGGLSAECADVRAAHAALKAIETEHAHRTGPARKGPRRSRLSASCSELTELAPAPGEENALATDARR